MNNDEIIGTWRSKDFPIYTFGDGIVITLHVTISNRATLWVKADKNRTLINGSVSIEDIDNDIFNIKFTGSSIHEKYCNVSARMHMKPKPQSFLINLPDYGERYMEKID